jgi:hypothetical protein
MRTLIELYSILVSGMYISGSNLLLLSCAGTTTKVHKKFISKVKVDEDIVDALLSQSQINKDEAPMDGQLVTCGEETTWHLQNYTSFKSTDVQRQVSQVCQAIASIADGIQEFAGIECADEFAARAHDSKDLPFVTSNPTELQALENRYGHVEVAIADATVRRKQKRAADARSKAALLANRTEEEIEQEEQKKAEARLKANATRRERYARRTADEIEEARLKASAKYARRTADEIEEARLKASARYASRTADEIEERNANRRDKYASLPEEMKNASRTADEIEQARLKANARQARYANEKYANEMQMFHCGHCGGTFESGGQGTINKCQKEMNGLKCNQTCQNTKIVEGETWRCKRERYKRPGDDRKPGERSYGSPYCGSKTCLTESQKGEKGWFQLQPEKN